MFWRKKLRETEKEILNNGTDEDADGIIEIKAATGEQIFSAYSYSGDELNPEFCEFIYKKAANAPINEELTVKIYSEEQLDKDAISSALKRHYTRQYREECKNIKRITAISLIMAVCGVIALAVLVLLNYFFDNFYVTTITEIAAWVFVWEAVDYFFLQRPVIKARCILIQRLFTAKIDISK